jgi:hypothetical protein
VPNLVEATLKLHISEKFSSFQNISTHLDCPSVKNIWKS